jgi:hypothetical protein
VIHQWDRFGGPYAILWLNNQDFIKDPLPKDLHQLSSSANTNANAITSGSVPLSEAHGGSTPRRTKTDAGVDVSDPDLYTGVDLHGDSSTTTVTGMASGYDLGVYERFVGTLRKSGFAGNIILGVAPDVSQTVLDYFKWRNVTPKILKWVDCTYKDTSKKNDIFQRTTCSDPYPDIKIRWSRFPLVRDWLEACETCTGPVLVTDVRDFLFQADPFGPGSPVVNGLQVYEEHKNQTTQHWLAKVQ